ncbi:hypothetical protein PSJ8397_01977 [Pseudooctadecabacter jejudonensis]|uniref:Uncharacterized protein n=1 Tax=Pseudooctadecabacter jejudonensis TaxID=1391910 RepID=A0A1Y5SHP2_9RHOB|nr:hypothetical protein PSJ8397_01977 [Pseudooctadecabacter jejudonensis]
MVTPSAWEERRFVYMELTHLNAINPAQTAKADHGPVVHLSVNVCTRAMMGKVQFAR